jgi:hypothetical protein
MLQYLFTTSSPGLVGDRTLAADQSALANLIDITKEVMEKDIPGIAWIVSAMAQRASAQAKIDASIAQVYPLVHVSIR